MRNSKGCRAFAAAMFTLFSLSVASADAQQDNAETRLRAALRQATVQLRQAQDQNATLMAKQAEADRDRMALADMLAADEKEIAALQQQLKGAQAASQQAASRFNSQRDNFAKVDAENRATFAKLQAAYNDAAQTARMRDDDVKQFEAANVQLRGRVQVCETKNAELYKLGKEVLDRYANRGSLSGVEPFTRLKRVEFENLAQEYEDKMRANEIVRPLR